MLVHPSERCAIMRTAIRTSIRDTSDPETLAALRALDALEDRRLTSFFDAVNYASHSYETSDGWQTR